MNAEMDMAFDDELPRQFIAEPREHLTPIETALLAIKERR
jgi:hypothetical protein